MKKIICFILVFSFLLLFTGCNQTKSNIEVSSFSYSEHAEIYKDNNPGVKHDGFKNKKECTIEWDTSHVSFDKELSVWMVSFYTEGMLGGDQCVYLDSNGITLLIVYGE